MAKPTILIVDDDREVTQYLSDVFKGDGWKVFSEKDGDWALKTFKSRRIDAVILDILIPVLNGFQVAEAIREDPRGKDVPIVIMSGIYRGAENRQEAIDRYGLLEYLNKPVEGERLRKLLRDALAKRETEQERSRTGTRRSATRPSEPAVAAASPRGATVAEPVAQVLPREPAALRGNLAATPFARILHELYRIQATGALFLMRDTAKKIVYVDSGRPVSVKSNLLRECLGQVLVARGRLDPDHAETLAGRARQQKRLIGELFVEQGLLQQGELGPLLEEQLAVKLADVIGWTEGEYQWKEAAQPPATAIRSPSSVATLVLKGVQGTYATARLEAEIAPLLSAFPAAAGDPYLRFQPLEAPAELEPALEALDGSRTLLRLVEDPRWDRTASMALALGLYYAGVIDLYDRKLRLPPPRTRRRREALLGGLPAPRAADPGVEEFLASELMKLKKLDHFRVLGLSRQSSTEDVEAAFDRSAWAYHPDAYSGLRGEARELAEGIFNRMRAAYLVLRSPFRRESYVEQLGDAGSAAGGADDTVEVERHLQDGLEHLEGGRWEQAAWHFRRAVGIDERSALGHAHLGFCLHKSGPTDHVATREALRHLERALALDPQLDVAHQYLGHVHLASEDGERAREHFQLALRLNPSNQDAKEQLSRLPEG